MTTAKDSDLLEMNGWPLGVNNRSRETEPGQSTDQRGRMSASLSLREAINVDLTKFGHPLRRQGYTQTEAGFTHSLWGAPSLSWGLCVREGFLCRVSSKGETTQLLEVHAYAPVSYAVVNGEVFWSNGLQMGRVDDSGSLHWGLPEPAVPQATVTQAAPLPPGTYRIATVYVDEFDEEYGASSELTVAVSEGEGLAITVPGGWPMEAVLVRVFVSQPNGGILYAVAETGVGGTFDLQQSQLGRGRELETLNLKQPKAGTIVRYFNGRVYLSRRDTVSFTEALRYGLTRPAQGIYMFPSDVTLMEPVADGMYVGHSEGVVFIAGIDPYDVVQRNVLSHQPVPRASTRVPGKFFDTSESTVPVWWGTDGTMVAGLPGGNIVQLSQDRLSTPRFGSGSMMFREREGMGHVVSSLAKGFEDSTAGATDSVVATVRRNTKVLNC